jgi:hypothetical protein
MLLLLPHVPATRHGYRVLARPGQPTIAFEHDGYEDESENLLYYTGGWFERLAIIPHTQVPATPLGYRIHTNSRGRIMAVEEGEFEDESYDDYESDDDEYVDEDYADE